jgi:tetratricopeptide (TPR) repeat protein
MSAQRADDALHPGFPPGEPLFVPSFAPPARLARLSPPRQFELLANDAAKQDAHAKLLYGVALQRLGRRISAQRQYEAAARLDPGDPETQVAAAVGRFDKTKPSAAFSRLGPLTKRYPHAATVRFHLGLMLLWLARSQPGALAEGKRQLRLARKEQPDSPLAREAKRLLAGLEGV